MFLLRKSSERGHANHAWLEAYHSFSFADYYDPENMGFSVLRVINEDRIAGGGGFPTHGHRDMEIITYVISGALQHKDTLGNEAVIKPGEVQKMSAGSGIRHSEFNSSSSEKCHLLQIWLEPSEKNIPPGYGQKAFDFKKENQLTLVASEDGRQGSIKIHQDVNLYVAHWKSGNKFQFEFSKLRKSWVQLVKGELQVNEIAMTAGDGLAIAGEAKLDFVAKKDAEFLFFELPN